MRRYSQVSKDRCTAFAARVPRFRWLRRAGIDAAMLVRTGGKQSMTYGAAVIGVSNALLRNQRSVASAASSPASGRGGQNIDMAMIVADGSAKGMADPAFDAHLQPIGEWANAVWEVWLPEISLNRLIRFGLERIARAKKVWAVCYGPAAAFIAT